MPTLNEADGMKEILPRIKPEWVSQILVADGKSKDNTVEVAKSFGCDVIVQNQKGIRHAYIEGFPHIKGEYVITFSPDGNCIPEDIPKVVAKLREGYDMVVASRYAKGASSDDDDAMTGFGNWCFTKAINLCHGGNYTDAMGIYRGYRTSLFYELGLDREDAYSTEKCLGTVIGIEPLLSIRAAKFKCKVSEVPSNEPARIAGIRKLQVIRWGGAYLLQVFREIYFYRRNKKTALKAIPGR